jgi:purine-binding chemotaxis protein CheW
VANEVHVVGFRVGSETFGVPIGIVHEIVRVPEVTAVPDAVSYVEGVINLRGKIIPIIDLRKRFGASHIQPDRKNRILVAKIGDTMVGLIVDAASEVLRLPQSEIDAPPTTVFDGSDQNYVTGVGKMNGRLVILIDLQKVLSQKEIRPMSTDALAQPVVTA